MSVTNELLPNSGLLQDVQILVVDNDYDSGNLYAVLLTLYGAKVTTTGAIKSALALLEQFTPDILICEMRFLDESVYPLIQQVRHLALNAGRAIPILVTSTYDIMSVARYLKVQVEAYLLKPIDPNHLVYETQSLMLSTSDYPLSHYD